MTEQSDREKAIDSAKKKAVSAKVHLNLLEEEYMELKGLTPKEHVEWARKLGAAERDLLAERDQIRDLYRERKNG